MKLLHLDIETAPNTAHIWGLYNQNIGIKQVIDSSYVLCWSAKWHGKKEVMFDSIRDSDPWEMMKGVWNLLDEADAVTSYNGRKFDLPTIQKEFVQMGMNPPSSYHHIDLFIVVRKEFHMKHTGIVCRVVCGFWPYPDSAHACPHNSYIQGDQSPCRGRGWGES